MLALAVLTALSGPLVLTVSPGGPNSSIAEAVAKAKGQAARIDIRPGVYRLTAPIMLDESTSGLTIRGAKGSRIVGGSILKRWVASIDPRISSSAKGHVYECELGDVAPGRLQRRGFGLPRQNAGLELFVDGEPMRPAAYPNDGWLRISAVPEPTKLSLDTDRPSTWSKDDEIWTLGYWQFDWAESYEPVASVDGRQVTLGSKPGAYEAMAGRRVRFLNVLEELDHPGEYVVDRKLRKAFLWPTKPIEKAEVLASEVEAPLIQVKGAQWVNLEGLQVEGGRSGGIQVIGGSHVRIDRCTVRNLGTYGISLEGCNDSAVTGCSLTGLGEFGISLDGGDRKTLTPGNLSARDNHIWAYSRWCRTYQPAVLINGVGNVVAHNWIHDAPHQAILLGGNSHLIEYNRIERVCTETGDAGAIYMGRNPTMRGTLIRFNYLHDLGPKVNTEGNYTGVMGVYLDDCWCGTTIFGNVFDMNGTGIMIGGGRDNVVENNVFLGCQPAIHFDARGIGWAKDFFKKTTEWGMYDRFAEVSADKPPYTTLYPKLATYLTDDPAFPKGNAIVRNVASGGKWMNLLDGLTEKDFTNEANVVIPEALPLDQALRQKPKGFQPIPVKDIGRLHPPQG